MSSICWIFLFLCLCYINVDGLNFASKLCSYQLFIICHIITHELPTIVELSVQSENFHMKTFIPIYYNNAYLRVHSVSVGRWFTMFHSFSVISGDTVKAIQLQCCVRCRDSKEQFQWREERHGLGLYSFVSQLHAVHEKALPACQQQESRWVDFSEAASQFLCKNHLTPAVQFPS